MTDTARDILERRNMTVIDKTDLETLMKDRLDFGFDSIYFRYSEVVNELAYYRAKHRAQKFAMSMDEAYAKEIEFWNGHKMHFYNALEQLVHAHPMEDRNGINK